MLNEKSLQLLDGALTRIFALKVARSTFREIQNVIFKITNGNREEITDIFEALFTGTIKPSLLPANLTEPFRDICRKFTIQIRLAKEIFERGDFINMVTSDLIGQEGEIAFINRLQRIDGEEFLFITDTTSTVHMLQHFFSRLQELEAHETGKNELSTFKKELIHLSSKLNALAADLAESKSV
jgi:hypothetical protein